MSAPHDPHRSAARLHRSLARGARDPGFTAYFKDNDNV